ncbi:PAS domain-containing sensor histidine kinase [Bacillus sp. FJAT-29790]|uniref:sensor histidine kinase n=1 Tax=Bacillus sp. FJAT-29790 TaxID=1895002 RepID=UPI0020B24384|nr:HAMP domain-containing sensor histidine kinase [Bacillus sp. FJAT-29790]
MFLFKFLRFATTFAIPSLFYVVYIILKNNSLSFTNNKYIHSLTKLFSRKTLLIFFIWSTVVYILNWTSLGIKGLTIKQIYGSHIDFYFPVYGQFQWIYILHMSSFIVFLFIIIFVSKSLKDQYIKEFLRSFSTYSILLFISGFINFIPGTGAIASSIGVVIFSVMIIFSFIKMNLLITLQYNLLIERQKKMDYTGNLAGSLIHEVKNISQVIKGFSQILLASPTLASNEKEMITIIQGATQQLEDLSNNYNDYIKFSKMDLKIEDLNKIIFESISFVSEIVKENSVTIDFQNRYSSLKAYVNKPYLQQVFINMLKNCSEAIPGEALERSITIEAEIINESIYIHLKDTGKGIPADNWESVFDPFTSSKSSGMGMGLPFVKKIIFEHRGDIKIVNSGPNGTHFQIEIPQYELSDLTNKLN